MSERPTTTSQPVESEINTQLTKNWWSNPSIVGLAIGLVIVVSLAGGLTWYWLGSEPVTKETATTSPNANDPNSQTQDTPADKPSQPTEEFFTEEIQGNLKIYTHRLSGVQFAYNPNWKAEILETGVPYFYHDLVFKNLPEGDSLKFEIRNIFGGGGPTEFLKEGTNAHGFKYKIFRSLGDPNEPDPDPTSQVVYLLLEHEIQQLKSELLFYGRSYLFVYSFPYSKEKTYLSQVVTELETIAKSFKYLNGSPYSVTLASGRRLSVQPLVNWRLVGTGEGTVTWKTMDRRVDNIITLHYLKEPAIIQECPGTNNWSSVTLDKAQIDYLVFFEKTAGSKCQDVHIMKISLDKEVVYLELRAEDKSVVVNIEDSVLLPVKSLKLES